jgi:hypothetical protein
MKTIIFSISAILGLSTQINAQVGAIPAPPPPAVPQVQAYSTTTETIHRKSTSDGKTVYDTRSYSTSTTQQDQDDDPQRTKSFSKTYALGKGDKVNVSNIYGQIIVKTWDKSEVKLDADIRAFANSEAEAQKLIDNVIISSLKNDDEALFKAQMEDSNGNWGNGSRNGKRWRREVKIYMTLYLPANAALTATQQYGNLEIPDFSGPTALKVQYGKLVTGDLKNVNNFISAQYTSVDLKDVNKATIKQQYGSGLNIASIGDLNLTAQYATVRIGNIRGNANIKQQYGSGLSISSVDNLDLDAQYASVKIGTVRGDAGIKVQYGSGLTIDQVDNLSLTSQYVAVKVGKLNGNFTAKSQYGGRLTVDHIAASSKIVNLDTEYITVNLGFAANYGGNFNTNVSYSSFKAGENITARRVGDDDDRNYSSKKEYTGTVGRGGASNVRVNARYGSVAFRGI